MKHYSVLITTIIVVLVFVSAVQIKSPAGASIYEETYTTSLNHIITKFYGVDEVYFPEGTCTQTAKQLYSNIAFRDLQTSEGFATTLPDRIKTMMFTAEKMSGIVNMVKGELFINKPRDNAILDIEVATGVPDMLTGFKLSLNGISGPEFIVTSGAFSTPTTDCVFQAPNGFALCDCTSHHPMRV